MLTELRKLWREDQYMPLGFNSEKQLGFFLSSKGSTYQVYARSMKKNSRRLIQSVDGEKDWFWDENEERLVDVDPGSTQEDFIRSENIISGFLWRQGCRHYVPPSNIENLAASVRFQQMEIDTGARVLWLLPPKIDHWILSLHGGPESYEGFEIRYGGLYREALRNNYAIAILNYSGSRDLSGKILGQAWGHWRESIGEDYSALMRNFPEECLREMTPQFIGASFGGALALLLAQKFSCKQVLLSSPLLELSHQRVRGGKELQEWFESRFSIKDFIDFSYKVLTSDAKTPVRVFCSERDEVLGGEIFLQLKDDKTNSLNWKIHLDQSSHAPKTYRDMRSRYGEMLKALFL
jgi:pimeloyl-ACP methyl ester carboxylesterase